MGLLLVVVVLFLASYQNHVFPAETVNSIHFRAWGRAGAPTFYLQVGTQERAHVHSDPSSVTCSLSLSTSPGDQQARQPLSYL